MRYLSCYLLAVLAVLGSLMTASAQTEVPILHSNKMGYVVDFKPPYAKIRVNIEDDYRDYYSFIDYPDSVLVFMDKADRRQYESKRQKFERDREKYEERKQKALSSNKPFKDQVPAPIDKAHYQQLKHLLKAGLEIEIAFYEYRYSKKFVMQDITILTDLKGSGSVSGTYEQLDGEIATVDGEAVRLKSGVKLVGEKGYKGRFFSSFKDMEKGMELKLRGQRQTDGILLVESGTVVPDEFTETDRKLLTTLRNTKKLSLDGTEVSFGNAKFNLLKDETINAYVSRVGRKLVPDHIKKLPKDHPAYVNFNFFVVIDTTFNACAYPDGSVFVHTQLLNEIDNEAQLAAVLGHEIAHVTYRHSRQEYEKSQGIAIGKAVFSTAMVAAYGMESADLANLVSAFGGAALSSSYSRGLENQADRIGLNYIYEAGYDPREAPKLWEKLFHRTPDVPTKTFGERMLSQAATIATLSEQGVNPTTQQVTALAAAALSNNAISSIYASHPSAGKRFKSLNALIIKNYQDADLDKLTKGETEYKSIQKRLRRLVKGLPATDDSEVAEQPGEGLKPAATKKPEARKLKPTGTPAKKKK
ncbi:M48 family peptidase [Fibrisoma montanum]|uniref:M48 family peptidase n=1 Tax=Fibrisoma montanum TaxID=2305895 RepID=A0A418MF75_9BACT|nr:M48 family metallopeptidase [Fibrisoma montanum]RIV25426.1 M48 family peptidase [Fibrisoma montanum]